ncbi:MAG: hypothetical protein SF123_12785 [Chloroflexota bacterium]|nr:hypothetical protein [Chloroflexota bacterium]
MAVVDELLSHIFENKQHALYPDFAGWVRGSRRFKAFAIVYRDKIRSKLRNAPDEHGIQDVRAELETAVLLLREERFTLEYEHYAATKQRGPDFTITFKTHTTFNIEVRRIRDTEVDTDDENTRIGKLMAVVCDKVGQMPPAIVNALWLAAERALPEPVLLHATIGLRQLAESKNEAFFTKRGFASAYAFLKQYQHLSGIVVKHETQPAFWENPIARHAIPTDIKNVLHHLVTATG